MVISDAQQRVTLKTCKEIGVANLKISARLGRLKDHKLHCRVPLPSLATTPSDDYTVVTFTNLTRQIYKKTKTALR